MAKKLFVAFFSIFFLAFFVLPKSAFALYKDSYVGGMDPNKAVKEYCKLRSGNQINLETWFSGKCSGSFQERIGFADLLFLDILSDNLLTYDESGKADVSDGSTIFTPLGTFLAGMTSAQPASSTQYLALMGRNLAKHSIVQPVYAQATGFGFRSLGPVLELWKVFRDIVYLLFALAFVVYGFMIMFRTKINPQTVIGIQSAIPSLIITLIIITFSYAIAGLIIDLTYVFQEILLSAIFSKITPQTSAAVSWLGGFGASVSSTGEFALQIPIIGDIIKVTTDAVPQPPNNIGAIFIGRYGGLLAPLLYIMMAITVGGTIPKILAVFSPVTDVNFVDQAIRSITNNALINIIVWLVLFIAILYTFFKITWMLIKAFVTVVFQIIFAPFLLLRGILPGSDSFGEWIRNIISNMAAFPATIVCFLLSFIFLGPLNLTNESTGSLIAPLVNFIIPVGNVTIDYFHMANLSGNINLPMPLGIIGTLTGGGAGATYGAAVIAIIGLGIFLMIPKIVEMVQEALKVPPFKHGTAIGEALTAGPIGFGIAATQKAAQEWGAKKVAGAAGAVSETVGGAVEAGRRTAAARRQAAQIPPAPPAAGGVYGAPISDME